MQQRFPDKPLYALFAGMHLVKSGLPPQEEERYIRDLAQSLLAYPHCRYYTMHCTGVEQYNRLRVLMLDQISYLSGGDVVEVG